MRRLILLSLTLLLWIEPLGVQALKARHYQLAGRPTFATASHIPGSPFLPNDSLPTEKQLSLAGLVAYPMFNIFLPAGHIWLGSVNIISSIVRLTNQIDNLNKITKELTSQKMLLLLPYLRQDGMELLTSFLHGEQNMLDAKGNAITVRPFKRNGQRNKGVSALMMKDLIDQFIQQFQEKHTQQLLRDPPSKKEKIRLTDARGSAYEEHLRSLLAQLGYVTWDHKTLHAMKQVWPTLSRAEREWELYHTLQKMGIIDTDGAAFKKKRTSHVQRKLADHPFSPHIQKLILHDLGLIHDDDVTTLGQNLPELLEEATLKDPFRDKMKGNIPYFLTTLERELDTVPLSPDELKDKIDLAILQSLFSHEELNQFMQEHHVTYSSKNPSDQLTLYKLALVKTIGIPSYTYLSLEEDLQTTQAFIMKTLHEQGINNDLYRIVCLKKENLTTTTLTFVAGLGYLTVGVTRTLATVINVILQEKVDMLNAFVAQSQTAAASGQAATSEQQINQLTVQIQTLTHLIQVLSLCSSTVLIGVGAINITLNSYYIITKLMAIKKLHNSKKVATLLDAHLQETTEHPWLHGEVGNTVEITRFNAVSDHYLKKLEKKSLINSVGLNFIWLSFASMGTLNGINAFLIALGITAIVTGAVAIGTGYSMFLSLITIPVAILVLREFQLKERLSFATQTVELFQLALAQKKPELDHKHQQLLQIFLKNIKESIDFATYSTEINYYITKLGQKDSFRGIETTLVDLHHCRLKALKHWNRLNKDSQTQLLLDELVQDELSRNKIALDPSVTKTLSASTFRSGIDVLIDVFNPGVSINTTGTFLAAHQLPPCNPEFEFERDKILSTLFNYTYQIYNNIRKDLIEYRYLLHKKNLQMRYFQIPLTQKERNTLVKRYNKRQWNSHTTFKTNNLHDLIGDLETLHNPLPKGSVVAWDDQFLPQLSRLIGFNKEFKTIMEDVLKPVDEEKKIDIPEHSQVELLIQYFLPLSLLKS